MKTQILFIHVSTLLFLLLTFSPVYGDTETRVRDQKERKHSISLNLGGHSGFYSIDYGYHFHKNWELTAGFGYLDFNWLSKSDEVDDDYFFRWVSTPVKVSRLFGEKRHKFELNSGILFMSANTNWFQSNRSVAWEYLGIVAVAGTGYRYNGNRFLFAATTNLLFPLNTRSKSSIFPLAGFRFGYRF